MVKINLQNKKELKQAISRLESLKLKSSGTNLKLVNSKIKTYKLFLKDL